MFVAGTVYALVVSVLAVRASSDRGFAIAALVVATLELMLLALALLASLRF